MARQDEPPRRRRNPVLSGILGRGIEKAGRELRDLGMVRQGRQIQAEAKAAQESSSDQPSPPTSTKPQPKD